MQRRAFLASSLALACGDSMASRDKVPFGMPPWHMWGNTARLELQSTPNFGGMATKQLVKINYKRPETWSFFFGARVINAASGGAVLGVHVAFDIIIGVGRTMFSTTPNAPPGVNALGTTVPAFVRFRFDVGIPIVPLLNQPKWTTTGQPPVMDDSTPLVLTPPVEWLPAQDIQCTVRAGLQNVGTATVEVTSWFAPRSHVRPDWFNEQFLGGETNGT
jgi:hypothetical protein